MPLFISSTVQNYPNLPYQAIADAVLGARYELSLTFIGDQRARTLNQQSRGKNYVPNVLSFPLANTAGEIYIAPSVATREARYHDMTPTGYVGYLFIHGLLHLKGLDHGATMDQLEKKYKTRFKLH